MKNEPRGNYNPAGEGEAAGRADLARINRHQRAARFAAALLKFEDAASALNAAWHDGVPEDVIEDRYPFDETPIDAVCRKITRFREGVDAVLGPAGAAG
jgi:hypothetical protein